VNTAHSAVQARGLLLLLAEGRRRVPSSRLAARSRWRARFSGVVVVAIGALMTGKGGSVTQQRYEPKVIDDDELAESIRQVQQERSTRLLLVVLGISAALAVGASAVYLAYSDQPDSVREIEAAQPGVR
jgi:hypothetical protein